MVQINTWMDKNCILGDYTFILTTFISKELVISWIDIFSADRPTNLGIETPLPEFKNSPLGPKKDKDNPKFKLKAKVRIKNLENKSCLTTWVQLLNRPLGPQKSKKWPQN